MPWRPITAADVLTQFTPIEQATLQGIQGATTNLDTILADVVAEFVGAMSGAGYTVLTDGTLPDQLRQFVIGRARWLWLASLPGLKDDPMLSDARRKLAETAEAMLGKISRLEAGRIEPPAGNTTAGSWNSQPKLQMRTQPIPAPAKQGGQGYANADGPTDT